MFCASKSTSDADRPLTILKCLDSCKQISLLSKSAFWRQSSPFKITIAESLCTKVDKSKSWRCEMFVLIKPPPGKMPQNWIREQGIEAGYKSLVYADQSRHPWTRLCFSLCHRRDIFHRYSHTHAGIPRLTLIHPGCIFIGKKFQKTWKYIFPDTNILLQSCTNIAKLYRFVRLLTKIGVDITKNDV